MPQCVAKHIAHERRGFTRDTEHRITSFLQGGRFFVAWALARVDDEFLDEEGCGVVPDDIRQERPLFVRVGASPLVGGERHLLHFLGLGAACLVLLELLDVKLELAILLNKVSLDNFVEGFEALLDALVDVGVRGLRCLAFRIEVLCQLFPGPELFVDTLDFEASNHFIELLHLVVQRLLDFL